MACNAAPAIQKQKDRVRDKSSHVQLWKGRRAKGLTRCLMKKKKKETVAHVWVCLGRVRSSHV